MMIENDWNKNVTHRMHAHGLQNQVKKNDSTFKSINHQKQVALTPNSLQPTSCVIWIVFHRTSSNYWHLPIRFETYVKHLKMYLYAHDNYLYILWSDTEWRTFKFDLHSLTREERIHMEKWTKNQIDF